MIKNLSAFLIVLLTTYVFSQTLNRSYPGCSNPTPGDFSPHTLISHSGNNSFDSPAAQSNKVWQLVRFSLLYNQAADDFDILAGGFQGKLLRYNSQDSTITELIDLNTVRGSVSNPNTSGDNGFSGYCSSS